MHNYQGDAVGKPAPEELTPFLVTPITQLLEEEAARREHVFIIKSPYEPDPEIMCNQMGPIGALSFSHCRVPEGPGDIVKQWVIDKVDTFERWRMHDGTDTYVWVRLRPTGDNDYVFRFATPIK